MKRYLVACLTAGVLMLVLASPALAQRDPFAEPNSGSSSGSTTEPQGDTSTDGDPTVAPNPQPDTDTGSDQLANTGSEPAPFLVIAYGLIVAGAGAVFIARSWSTARP